MQICNFFPMLVNIALTRTLLLRFFIGDWCRNFRWIKIVLAARRTSYIDEIGKFGITSLTIRIDCQQTYSYSTTKYADVASEQRRKISLIVSITQNRKSRNKMLQLDVVRVMSWSIWEAMTMPQGNHRMYLNVIVFEQCTWNVKI